MAKFSIDCDEYYPFYGEYLVDKNSSDDQKEHCIEIPGDKIEWLNRVDKEFKETQDYLAKLLRKIYKI